MRDTPASKQAEGKVTVFPLHIQTQEKVLRKANWTFLSGSFYTNLGHSGFTIQRLLSMQLQTFQISARNNAVKFNKKRLINIAPFF